MLIELKDAYLLYQRQFSHKASNCTGIANSRSALEAVEAGKLNAEAVSPRKSSAQEIAVVSEKLSIANDSLKGKGFGDAKSAVKSNRETDFWWSKLPYVLVCYCNQ